MLGGPWGGSHYIYGRYRQYRSNEVDESFFPIIFSRGGSHKRTLWLDEYVKSGLL